MDPLSITAGAIALAQFSKQLADYVYAVKNAPTEAYRLHREIESLQVLLDQIATSKKGKGATAIDAVTVSTLCQPSGPLDQLHAVLKKLGSSLNATQSGSLKSRLIWPFRSKEVKAAITVVERLKTTFIFALNNDALKITQSIKSDAAEIRDCLHELLEGQDDILREIDSVKNGMAAVRRQTEELASQKHTDDLRQVAAWLCPDTYSSTQFGRLQEKLKERIVESSAFCEQAAFVEWRHANQENGRHVLHCPGIPGAGKTVVAATVVEMLQKNEPAESALVAFNFCLYDDSQSVEDVLGFLVRQMLLQQKLVPRQLVTAFNRHGAHDSGPSLDELIDALETFASMYPTSYIIIDALDEFREEARDDFLHCLLSIKSIGVRLLITSRPMPQLEEILGSGASTLEISPAPQEIEALINDRIKEPGLLNTVVGKDAPLVKDIHRVVVEKSKSMFLLAKLHLDAIAKKPLKSQIRKTLSSLADTIPSTYVQALERIDEDARLIVTKILAWVCFAKFPLAAEQVIHLIAIEEDSREEIDQDSLLEPELVSRLCQGLVATEPTTGRLHLIHETLQSFLTQSPDMWFPDVKEYLATSCVTFLMSRSVKEFPKVVDGGPSWKEYWSHQSPVLEYISRNFAAHCIDSHKSRTQSLLQELFEDDENFDRLKRVLARARFGRGWASRSGTGMPGVIASYGRMHLAAGLGLTTLLLWLIQRGADPNKYAYVKRVRAEEIEEYINPLGIAARQGNIEAVNMLLDAGADINAPSRAIPNQVTVPFGKSAKDVSVELFSPLASAARQRQSTTMKLLIKRGASMSPTGLPEGTLMPGTETRDSHDLLRHVLIAPPSALSILLHAGLIVKDLMPPVLHRLTLHDSNDKHLAHWTATRTRREADEPRRQSSVAILYYKMKLILDHGIDINAKDAEGRTTIMYAVQGFRVNAARFLVEQGADLNITDAKGRTPLDWALEVLRGTTSELEASIKEEAGRLSSLEASSILRSGKKPRGPDADLGSISQKRHKLSTIVSMLQEALGLEVSKTPWKMAREKVDKVESVDYADTLDDGLQFMYEES